MVSEDTKSVAIECENVSLPVFEPNSPVELSLGNKFDPYSSNVGILLILFIVLGVSDEDHFALRTVIEQDMLVGKLATSCVVVL